jgi:DNA polymerase-3 subunit gamma/tau
LFENVIGQEAVITLAGDIRSGRMAPAMLFAGPAASGKGTAALELGRIISCEKQGAPWNCACPACARHRLLLHPDLLCLGSRPFSAEIAASADAFLKEPESAAARTFFIRSIRKLLARFSPVLWEDESGISKLNPMLLSLEEGLDELDRPEKGGDNKKIIDALKKTAFKLEDDGIKEGIPINQLRKAASWAHLAPVGKGKLLFIENADRMGEGAKNSLLKLLEEPPLALTVLLSSTKPNTLLKTILSRVRVYRFVQRDEDAEKDVLRRVFRSSRAKHEKSAGGSIISAYLDSFLPLNDSALRGLAAFFAASTAAKVFSLCKKRGAVLPAPVSLLGKYAAPLAEAAGLGRPERNCGELVNAILKGASGFGVRSLFGRFLRNLLAIAAESQAEEKVFSRTPLLASYYEIWRRFAAEADAAVSIYNQSAALALERLFTESSGALAEMK